MTICGHDAGRAEQAAARLGNGTRWIVTDLTHPMAGERFVTESVELMGGLDILVTNAPGPPAGTFATARLDDYPKALELNLLSVVRMCAAAVPAMRRGGWGRIVAITSISVITMKWSE